MKIDPDMSILDLSPEEKTIFDTLKIPSNPTEIAQKSKIPRTSLNYILQKMLKRGLIIKLKSGKRFLYQQNSKEKLSEMLDKARAFFDPTLSIISVPSFSGLKVYKGVKTIIDLQTQFLHNEPKYSRVKAIQPNKSFLNMYDKASVDEIILLNKAISDSGVILDAIVESNAYQVYDDYWKTDPEGFERLNKTFLNRTTDYVDVAAGSISFESEMWIYFDSIVIVNWKDKNAIVITNPETKGLLEALYDSMKASGRKVNHIEEIERRNK